MKNPNRKAAARRSGTTDFVRPDTILVYNSHRGSTHEYAEWITKALDCDVMSYSRKMLGVTTYYKNVIFMGWVKGTEITKLNVLKQNQANFHLSDKNLIIVAVGAMEPTEKYIDALRFRNGITEDGPGTFFYLPGRFDPASLSPTNKSALKMMMPGMCSIEPEKADEVVKRFETGYDGVDKKNILPIVEVVMQTRIDR